MRCKEVLIVIVSAMALTCSFASGSRLMADTGIADDDLCEEDEEYECCYPYLQDEDMEENWYDDTAGWPGQREDAWFIDLEH